MTAKKMFHSLGYYEDVPASGGRTTFVQKENHLGNIKVISRITMSVSGVATCYTYDGLGNPHVTGFTVEEIRAVAKWFEERGY